MAERQVPLAKLTQPRLYRPVARERLFDLLDASREHPVTWVCGPPGGGKTTLVASYIQTRKLKAAWFQLDAGDADPATFFYYMGLVGPSLARGRRPLPLLTAEYLSDIAGFTRRYFREFFSRLGFSGLLVLDNFQTVPQGTAVQQVLSTALREVPHGVNIIVLSRSEPPPFLTQLLADRTLEVIDAEQIKLTADEARSIAESQGVPDSPQRERVLYSAHGWAAGLVLLLERLRRGRADPAEESPSPRNVFEYFTGEVFDRLSDQDRRVLVCAALLPRPTAELIDKLSETEGSEGTLTRLYERRMFLDRRSEHEPIYDIHPLFRTFLRAEGGAVFPVESLEQLKQRAVNLLVEYGHEEEALDVALDARQWNAAEVLVVKLAPRLLLQGRDSTLRDHIRLFPGHALESNAWLIYWLGMSLQLRSPTEARVHFERAYAAFASPAVTLGRVLCGCGALETHIHEWVHLRGMDAWIDTLEADLSVCLASLDADSQARSFAALISAVTAHKPNHPALEEWVALAAKTLRLDLEPRHRIKLAGALLAYYCWTGAFEAAELLVHEITPALDADTIGIPDRALWGVWLGYYYFYSGDTLQARTVVDAALDLSARNGLGHIEYLLHRVIACVYLHSNELQRVDETLGKIAGRLNTSRQTDVAYYEKRLAWLELLKNRPTVAREHARKGLAAATGAEAMWLRAQCVTTLAQALVECKDYGAAIDSIIALRSALAGINNPFFDFSLGLVEAYAQLQSGQSEQGIAALRAALELGRRCRFVNYFVWSPKTMSHLCAVALEKEIETKYVRELVKARAVPAPNYAIRNWPWPIEIHTLGRFRVLAGGEAISFGRKAPKQLLRLLKALIALGGEDIPDEKLTDAVWPDLEADAAHAALAVAVRRLRTLLGGNEVLHQQKGMLSLNLEHCWVDAIAFDRLLDTASATPAPKREQALSLYRGRFLLDESDAIWTFELRDRLHRKFLHHLAAAAERYAETNHWADAQRWYLRGLEADNLAESFYQGLIRCYLKLGQRGEAAAAYGRMRETLSKTLGIAPSHTSEMLYAALLQR